MAGCSLTDYDVCLKCVDVNEVIYDENEKHLKRIVSVPLDCKEELFKEILTNLQACQDVCFNYVKQLVIIKEPRVKFKPENDVPGLQMKIEETKLSLSLKKCLMEISKVAYDKLKEAGLLKNLVEFDSERHATVDVFGKTQAKMVAFMDTMTEIDIQVKNETQTQKTQKDTEKIRKSDKKKDSVLPAANNKVKEKKSSGIIKSTAGMTDTQTAENEKDQRADKKPNKLQKQNRVHESKGSLTGGSSKSDTETEAQVKRVSNTAIVTFVLTPRISVSAVQVFKQLLYFHVLPTSSLFLLVCHIGPLNEDQELILYEYSPDETLTDECQKPGYLNLAKLENIFRDAHGQRLQKLADLKEYFKYYIYDCPGVKDHAKDNNDRLQRYLKKRAIKKQNKKKSKEEQKEESEFGSDLAEPYSQQHQTKIMDSDSDITSAADLSHHTHDSLHQI